MNPIKELSLPNYTAIAVLARMGVIHPSLEQIHIIESLVSIVTDPQEIAPETIRQCVGDNNLAYYFLFVKTNEWCKITSDEETLVDFQNEIEEEEEEVTP